MKTKELIKRARKFAHAFRVTDGDKFRLKDFKPHDTLGFKDEHKPRAKEALANGVRVLAELQDKLYAYDKWALLLIFQAMDAAGKDGAIKHVMSGVNPQGCQVYSFKSPSAEDLDHDYLWRCTKCLPNRGHIGIFNRSYYEETLVVRVHPEFLQKQKIPPSAASARTFGKIVFGTSGPLNATLRTTASSPSNSSCMSPKRNRKSDSWSVWNGPKRTGNFPARTWPSAATGTIIRRPTRTRSATPPPGRRRGTSCRRTTNGSPASSSPRQ